jgi:hypothetical protein
MENLPDRASDSGPEPQQDRDWRDWLYEAEESCTRARRAETSATWTPGQAEIRNRLRLRHIQDAMDALQRAKELLCR